MLYWITRTSLVKRAFSVISAVFGAFDIPRAIARQSDDLVVRE